MSQEYQNTQISNPALAEDIAYARKEFDEHIIAAQATGMGGEVLSLISSQATDAENKATEQYSANYDIFTDEEKDIVHTAERNAKRLYQELYRNRDDQGGMLDYYTKIQVRDELIEFEKNKASEKIKELLDSGEYVNNFAEVLAVGDAVISDRESNNQPLTPGQKIWKSLSPWLKSREQVQVDGSLAPYAGKLLGAVDFEGRTSFSVRPNPHKNTDALDLMVTIRGADSTKDAYSVGPFTHNPSVVDEKVVHHNGGDHKHIGTHPISDEVADSISRSITSAAESGTSLDEAMSEFATQYHDVRETMSSARDKLDSKVAGIFNGKGIFGESEIDVYEGEKILDSLPEDLRPAVTEFISRNAEINNLVSRLYELKERQRETKNAVRASIGHKAAEQSGQAARVAELSDLAPSWDPYAHPAHESYTPKPWWMQG